MKKAVSALRPEDGGLQCEPVSVEIIELICKNITYVKQWVLNKPRKSLPKEYWGQGQFVEYISLAVKNDPLLFFPCQLLTQVHVGNKTFGRFSYSSVTPMGLGKDGMCLTYKQVLVNLDKPNFGVHDVGHFFPGPQFKIGGRQHEEGCKNTKGMLMKAATALWDALLKYSEDIPVLSSVFVANELTKKKDRVQSLRQKLLQAEADVKMIEKNIVVDRVSLK